MKSHRVETSTYNERREHDYESSVRNDAYRARLGIEISDGAVFLVSGEERQFLCRPAIPKRFWYETWLAFKARYSGTPGFDD